jgi:hypothetical protein
MKDGEEKFVVLFLRKVVTEEEKLHSRMAAEMTKTVATMMFGINKEIVEKDMADLCLDETTTDYREFDYDGTMTADLLELKVKAEFPEAEVVGIRRVRFVDETKRNIQN